MFHNKKAGKVQPHSVLRSSSPVPAAEIFHVPRFENYAHFLKQFPASYHANLKNNRSAALPIPGHLHTDAYDVNNNPHKSASSFYISALLHIHHHLSSYLHLSPNTHNTAPAFYHLSPKLLQV